MSKITLTEEVETIEMIAPGNFGGFSHGRFHVVPTEDGHIHVPSEIVNVAASHGCIFVPEPEVSIEESEWRIAEMRAIEEENARIAALQATPAPTEAPAPTPEPTEAPAPTPEPTSAPEATPEPTPAPEPDAQ